MRTTTVRSLVMPFLILALAFLNDPVRAGGVGVSEARDSVESGQPSLPSGTPVPFHLYKARVDRSPKARRDFDFLWSDTYKSLFRMPLDSLSGPEQINDLQRLAETIGEFPGNNPLGLAWTDIQMAYNTLSRNEFYRSPQYNDSPASAIGLKVAQPGYNDVERNHIDAYVYAPSFAGFSQWSSYIGDRQASNPEASDANIGQFPSDFASSAEDSLTHVGAPLRLNSVMIPGPRPDGVAATGPTRWTRPGGTANAYLIHESTHAINFDTDPTGQGEAYLHMFASGSEVVTGVSTDPPAFDVDYHSTLGVTAANLSNAYPHWQSFMAYLAFNWRGADTTAGAWQDDLLPRWSKGPAAERDLYGLARRLRNSECAECTTYPGFLSVDSLARVQRLIHDWRVAIYVNSSTLGGGRYGFPPHFGFSPADQLGAWRDIDTFADNNVSIPPVVTINSSPAGRAQWLKERPAGPGASARELNLEMFGSEYVVFKADPTLSLTGQKLIVRLRPELAKKQFIEMHSNCEVVNRTTSTGRLFASLVTYSGLSDELFRHPELATGVVTKSIALDSLRGNVEFEAAGFGTSTKAAVLVVTLEDGAEGVFSATGAPSLAPSRVQVGAWLLDGSLQAAPVAVSPTALPEGDAAWSPDGSRLAYRRVEADGTSRIYLRNANGSGAEQPLRSATARQAHPVWSPRGDRIAYLEGDSTRIWIADVATGQAAPSVYWAGRVRSLAYSPDGGRLAYLRELLLTQNGTEDPPHENDPHGSQPIGYRREVRIRNTETGVDSLAFQFIEDTADSMNFLSDIRWTPDSRFLTFSRYDAATDSVHLHQLDVRTLVLTTHGSQAPGARLREFSPGSGPVLTQEHRRVPFAVSYSANGLFYCNKRDGFEFALDTLIAVRDTVLQTSATLGLSGTSSITQPRWSPDGTRVVYTATSGGNSDIYVQQARPDRAPVMWNTVLPYYTFTNCAGFNMSLNATDPDGDAVTYRAFGLPAGASLNGSNQVIWPVPVVGDHWFTVQALDAAGAVDNRLVHLNVYDGGDCGGGGGGEGEGEILGGHGARRVADSRRLMNPLMGSPKAVNSFLDGVEPGVWASQVARLSAAQLDSAGHYIANMVGLRPGEFKLDRARLLVVDHDPSVVPLATQEGVVLGAKRNPATLAATGSSGAHDGLLEAGTLITMAWADSDSVAGVLVECARAGAVTNEAAWGIAVDVRESEGWREVGVIKPRAGYDALASSLQGTREVRLRFLSDVYVREIAGYAWASGLEAASTTSACVSATVPNAADSLATVDGASLRLARGQSAALTFDAPPQVEGKRRTLFLDYVASFTPGPGGAAQTRASGNGPAGRFALHSTSPNPFERSTLIRFELPEASRVQIEVFDAQGRRVRSVADRSFEPGVHSLEWDGADASGRRVGPGVYLVRMRAGGFRADRRVIRLGH